MIYRTAHRATYRDLNNNLGTLSYRIAQLTNQIASERRINTPSDDPSGAAKVLGTRSTLSNIEQYKTNLAVSELWLSDSGNSIQNIKNTLDQIYAKTEQGATDTTSAQMGIIADEINLLFESLLQMGNKKIGDSYIFSGQQVTTQPFGAQVEAHKVTMGCQNSTKWTGKVQNYGDAAFNNRPDLPVHSQKFLVEVVQPGGVDSRYYTKYSDKGFGLVKGNGYTFEFEAKDKRYNDTEVKFVAGPANTLTTGHEKSNNALSFTNGTTPTKVVYQYGDSTATTASWDSTEGVLTVSLKTDGGSPPKSVATANDVIAAVGASAPAFPGTVSSVGVSDGSGVVSVGSISFNNNSTWAEVDEGTITVYLARDNNGAISATANDVMAAIAANAQADAMVDLSLRGGLGGSSLVSPTPTAAKLEAGRSYTLAQASMDPKGTQNGLIWSVKNNSAFIGEAGNNFSVEYKVPEQPFQSTPSINYNSATGEIVVNVAVDEALYNKVFAQVYTDPKSGAYQDQEKANEMALREAVTTTANDVRQMVAEHPDLKSIIDVNLIDGNSGDGRLNKVPKTQFTDGYDQAAMFRVSQDGGKTWGPPMSFSASEYMTGDMFYNSTLGHASLTTALPGQANDLVFTARQMGTWGNDLRVEYKLPDPADFGGPASVSVGPNPWNICVTLATDASGKVLSTANEIKDLINNHPEASQLVLADLANYHEGGDGLVRPMDCKNLSVGEPYQIDGKSVITPLGHATGSVDFSYAPPNKCPNIEFQAIKQGPEGNDIGIRYTTSADPTFYNPPDSAHQENQDFTSVRYEKTADGKTVLVVHLATEPLPSCPDPDEDREASDKWKELYPLYSCTSAVAVTATAGSVVQAIIDLNTKDPANAAVWPSLERWPDGWDSTAKVGPTNGTVWLTGGNEQDDAGNHGINLKFIPDGTSLQVGDVFEVPVGWYRGDEKNIDINADSGYRTTMNTTGNNLFGGNGELGNVLDTVQRLIWGLQQGDTELVGKELPKVRDAIERLTTLETKIGTKQIRNEFVLQNLETSKLSAQNLLSNIEDVDFSQLITDLKNAQTVYEACLGATGLTSRVSLLNYI